MGIPMRANRREDTIWRATCCRLLGPRIFIVRLDVCNSTLNQATPTGSKFRLPVAALLSLMTVCLASPASANRTNSQDTAFVRIADQYEIGDVRIAALALRKSGDQRVVSFATRMRDVDSQLHGELISIANAQRVSSPSAIGPIYESQLERRFGTVPSAGSRGVST